VPLARRFARVYATDASATQIASAETHERVEYRVAPAQRSGLPDGSADLVTVAQAAHWLDLEAFYEEVRRVARPRAALVLVTYGNPILEGAADAILERFYYETVGPYWPPERRHVEDGYRSLPFPFPEVAPPPIAIEVSWSVDDLAGYVGTWSAVKEAEKVLGRGPYELFQQELRAAWGDPQRRRTVHWPLSMRAGHVTPASA
jgi:SAM-dependent methyltransferase